VAIAKQNEAIRYYSPGQDITAYPTAAVTGKRCVTISATRQAGPALNTSTSGGNVSVAHASAAGAIFGVAAWDAGIGELVDIRRGGVVPITADGAITAGQRVEVGTTGKVRTLASGIAIGLAVADAADGADAQIALYD
jgi:predicted RecA/RadA family phage recombinase